MLFQHVAAGFEQRKRITVMRQTIIELAWVENNNNREDQHYEADDH